MTSAISRCPGSNWGVGLGVIAMRATLANEKRAFVTAIAIDATGTLDPRDMFLEGLGLESLLPHMIRDGLTWPEILSRRFHNGTVWPISVHQAVYEWCQLPSPEGEGLWVD